MIRIGGGSPASIRAASCGLAVSSISPIAVNRWWGLNLLKDTFPRCSHSA